MGDVVDLNEYRKRKAAEKKKKKSERPIPVWHPSMGTEPPKVNPAQFAKMQEWADDE
jgi:hypothetical protein